MAQSRSRQAARKTAPVAKVSVSLLAGDEAWLRARALKEKRPFSTVLADAIAEARAIEARRELLAWLEAGQVRPVSASDLDAVRDEWRAPARRRRARKVA